MPLTLTRALLTIILPGMVAIGPWMLLAILMFPELHEWYVDFTIPFHFATFGLAVIAGCVFEEVGNYLEKRWDTKKSKEDAPQPEPNWVSEDWYAYLARSFGDAEPVGYRYLSRKVTALYFELGMMCATPIALLATALLISRLVPGFSWFAFSVGFMGGIIMVALWTSAKHTHSLLCEIRHIINFRIDAQSAGKAG